MLLLHYNTDYDTLQDFDAIVELLLTKTADANRFIRQDASVALQILVRSVPPFHTVRAISQRSPCHKNDLVRISCARLFLTITEHFGVGLVLNPTASDSIRKRILMHMTKFIKDKNYKTRYMYPYYSICFVVNNILLNTFLVSMEHDYIWNFSPILISSIS